MKNRLWLFVLLFSSALRVDAAEISPDPIFSKEPTVVDSCISHGSVEDEVIYAKARKEAQSTWLELYKLPKLDSLDQCRTKMREVLVQLYKAQNSYPRANYIENSTETALAETIQRIQRGELNDFPKDETFYAYHVIKQDNGTLDFSPIMGKIGCFSIDKSSKHYSDACKHIGSIKVGEMKSVPDVPIHLLPSR